jgi:phosphatidylglycerol---prolipoprotein diacylglyceryl transferase
VHPEAFTLGRLTVHWYGIFVALGFIAAIWTAERRGVRYGIAPGVVSDVGFWILVGAIVGARLLFVSTHWTPKLGLSELWRMLIWDRSGFVFYGGLLGASAATIVYVRWKKLPLWRIADAMAPSIALGHGFGRLGCLMTGCCFGRVCDVPWAVRFPKRSPAWEMHVDQAQLSTDSLRSLPVHPTQLYEAILNLALFGALAWLYRRKKFDGQVFAVYLLAYSIVRSTVELFRGDYPSYVAGWITPAHWVSAGLLVAGAVLWWKLPRKPIQSARQSDAPPRP